MIRIIRSAFPAGRLVALLLLGTTAPGLFAEERKAPLTKAPSLEGLKFRDAATHDQLATAMKTARREDPMKKLKIKPLEVDPSTVNQPKDFVENSTVLCFNGIATFVPKQAVLNLPDRLKDRTTLKKGSHVKSFAEFATANRGWVSTFEIKLDQALGKTPIDEKKQEWLAGSGRVVIATLQGGPVSVLPYVDRSEEIANATSTKR